MEKEIIKVTDKWGFIYEVAIEYKPHLGFATALSDRDAIIGQVEYGKLHEPMTDSDAEWESYEERLEDWKCDAKIDLTPKCEEYFNKRDG